jgi:hypothetical protein
VPLAERNDPVFPALHHESVDGTASVGRRGVQIHRVRASSVGQDDYSPPQMGEAVASGSTFQPTLTSAREAHAAGDLPACLPGLRRSFAGLVATSASPTR